MCRIAGIIDSTHPVDKLQELVKGMCQLLKHGGPDDEGIYVSQGHSLVLGNRRLALLDLSQAGHQPMSYGNCTITYNGEMYNFPELKAELVQLGYTFKSHSDTEVILASYAAWGTDAFRRFNGMFAFALLDKQMSALYLVRDCAGIKPLYYATTNEQLVFASEVRAFSMFPELIKEDERWPVYMMAYGHLPEPVTTLSKVKPLAKGHFLKYDLNEKKYEIEEYCRFEYSEEIESREEVLSLIRSTLSRSVKRHLLSDAPIGVFLSGGIDSSITALLANDKGNRHLNTLSLYFAEAHYSEKKYQDMVLHRLSCNHHQHLLSEVEFHHHFPNIIRNMDLPSTDGINTWFISKYARETGLKAVLSGVGGDELYGGYPSFNRMGKVKMLEKLPSRFLKSNSIGGSKKLRRLSYLSLGGAKGRYLFLRGHFTPREIAAHLSMNESQVWDILREEPVLPRVDHLSVPNNASWMEFNMYMQNQLLRDSDVMSMAHGVEIRVPFLDKEFIELSMRIRSGVKYSGRFGKQLLIDAFRELLPEPIWNRPKMGFSFPFREWLAKDEFVRSVFNSGPAANMMMYKNFTAGKLHWSQLMSLLLILRYEGKPASALN